jgi:thiol:disulfide interchange protein
MALFLPFLLGIGMAIPWPIAGAGLSALPRPGAWMVRVKQVFGVLILGFAAYYGYLAYELLQGEPENAMSIQAAGDTENENGWIRSLPEGLELARHENKKVLVDVWATWCKNCLTMDRTTFENPEVKQAIEDFVKIKFQAEDPEAPLSREVMKRFKGVGLPLYAVLEPKDKTQK